MERTQFELRLEVLINEYSMENGSDTPDFILATYLNECLLNFDATVKRREEWYGRQPRLSKLPEEGVNIPQIIELDNTNPVIDYDSTGNPPANITDAHYTGDKPDEFPSTTSGIHQATTSHKPDIHPLSKKLKDIGLIKENLSEETKKT